MIIIKVSRKVAEESGSDPKLLHAGLQQSATFHHTPNIKEHHYPLYNFLGNLMIS